MKVRTSIIAAVGATAMSLLLAACGGVVATARTATTPTTATTAPPARPSPVLAVPVKPAPCPAHGPGAGAPGTGSEPRGQSPTSLVPAGPRWATICRYAGYNQRVPAGTLERSKVVSGAALARLVALADQGQSVAGRDYMCPFSQGLVDDLFFVYPDDRTITVTVDIDGCQFANRGNLTVTAGPVVALLKSLVGQDPLP